MARVDALAPLFSTHWHTATRSDVIRGLILSALEHYERGMVTPHPREDLPTEDRGLSNPTEPSEAKLQAPPKAPPGQKRVKAGARKGKR